MLYRLAKTTKSQAFSVTDYYVCFYINPFPARARDIEWFSFWAFGNEPMFQCKVCVGLRERTPNNYKHE